MATEDSPRDGNFVTASLFEIDGTDRQVMPGQIDQLTGRILVDASGGGAGTVTSVSVVTANGFAGSVANPTTTPAITLSTTLNTPVLAGNGTALTAATTTGTGSTVVLSASPTMTGVLTVPRIDAPTTLVLNAPVGNQVQLAVNNTVIAGVINTGFYPGADNTFALGGAATRWSDLRTVTATLSGALTYGGVTLSNSVTGTGSMVLSTSPTLSGATITTSTVNGVTLTTGGGTSTFLNANGTYSTPAGSGDVSGPGSSTDNAIVRWDGTTGTIIQNSAATIADTSGNITAGTYNGNAIGAGSTSGTNTGDQTTISGNAGSATVLQNARTIGILTGDATSAGSSFNGSANNTNAVILATVNSNVGTFGSATQVGTFTVNGKGLTTAASNVTITPAVGSITGLGTGVATALAVNVGSAGAFVTFNGALGTPSSGVATNLTGTASGLTAGTVTTNANLTGDVTSVGNATTLATVNSNVGSFTNASITVNAKGLITAASSGSGGTGITWTEVTGTSQSAAINSGYITNNAGLVTVTIPTTAAVGSIVRVAGKGAGGWKLAQNASEIIHFDGIDTTTGTGGSLASTVRYDAVEIVCIVADTEWVVISSIGNLTVT